MSLSQIMKADEASVFQVPEVPEHANFCSACGSLLDLNNIDVGVQCDVCNREGRDQCT